MSYSNKAQLFSKGFCWRSVLANLIDALAQSEVSMALNSALCKENHERKQIM
jgi:hypothetical protein